ncbi:MAG: branched-chain amino acid ABC transporter permease [Hyphomicrobiales bacterium]
MAATARLRVATLAAPLLLGAIAAALPWFGASSYVQILVYYAAYYLALGQAWNLMSGLTGYVSFAHGALAGIGAYATVMALNAEWPLALGIVAGPLAAVLASLVIGATSLRLRGTAFTFATLFFQALALHGLRKLPATGGPGGLALQEILPIALPQLLMIGLATASTITVMLVRASRVGVRLLAIKGDETAALSLGIASAKLKLVLFCASATLAGLAGATHGLFTASLYPDVVFSVDVSLLALAVPLIGGVATASGPVAGAILYVGMSELLQIFAPSVHVAAVGILLLAVIVFMPAGLVPFLTSRLRRRRVPVARPVPAGRGAE